MIYFCTSDGYMFSGASIEKDIALISSRIDKLTPSKKHKILSKIAKYTMSRLEAKEWFDGFRYDDFESTMNHLMDGDYGYVMEASRMSEDFANIDHHRNQLNVYSNVLDLMVGYYSTFTNLSFIVYALTEKSREIIDSPEETMSFINSFVSAVECE